MEPSRSNHAGWTASELEAMTVSERYELFMQFDDAPEIAFRARAILEGPEAS